MNILNLSYLLLHRGEPASDAVIDKSSREVANVGPHDCSLAVLAVSVFRIVSKIDDDESHGHLLLPALIVPMATRCDCDEGGKAEGGTDFVEFRGGETLCGC